MHADFTQYPGFHVVSVVRLILVTLTQRLCTYLPFLTGSVSYSPSLTGTPSFLTSILMTVFHVRLSLASTAISLSLKENKGNLFVYSISLSLKEKKSNFSLPLHTERRRNHYLLNVTR